MKDIKDFLEFGEDRVYFLLGLARPKENEELTDNSKPCIRLVVKDKEDFERKLERLRHATQRHDYEFRAYIGINARNTVKTYFNLRQRMDSWTKKVFMGSKDQDSMDHFKRIDKRWKSELQRSKNKDETYFIFDVDEEDKRPREIMEKAIREADGEIVMTRETPNGWHIITEPFDYTTVSMPEEGRGKIENAIDYEVLTDGMLFLEMIE